MLLRQQRSDSDIHFYRQQWKDGQNRTSLLVLIYIFACPRKISTQKRLFVLASKRLSDLIRRPYDLYRAGVFDEYLMGLMNQVAQAMDDSITQEVTNHLFKKEGAR